MLSKRLSIALATALSLSTLLGVQLTEASPDVETNQAKKYMIAFKNEKLPQDVETLIVGAGGQVIEPMPDIGGLEVESSDPSFLSNLKSIPGIQAANLELSYRLDDPLKKLSAPRVEPVTDIPQAVDVDDYWNYQWDIRRITNNGVSYSLNTGDDTVVGVIDSGIDPLHPDLEENVIGGKNFVPAGGGIGDPSETGDPDDYIDRSGHGTHVAGSIAGNGKIKGVGPDLKTKAYRVFPANGGAPTTWITEAIIQAVHDQVDVINMSVGGFQVLSGYTVANAGPYKDIADMLLFKRAIKYAVKNNVVVVAAAGNESLNLTPKEITEYVNQTYGEYGIVAQGASIAVPAQLPGVLAVSSSNKWSTEQIAYYSNYGARSVDVAAPGGDVGPAFAVSHDVSQMDFHYMTLSTWPTYLPPYPTSNLEGYALALGTSMASPKVAGIAGVIRAANPELSPAQVTSLIKQTAVDYGKKGEDALFGAGEANIYNSLIHLKQ